MNVKSFVSQIQVIIWTRMFKFTNFNSLKSKFAFCPHKVQLGILSLRKNFGKILMKYFMNTK